LMVWFGNRPTFDNLAVAIPDRFVCHSRQPSSCCPEWDPSEDHTARGSWGWQHDWVI